MTRSRFVDAVLIAILALLPLLFFWRLITPNPPDRMVIAPGDFTEQYFSLRAFTAYEWVTGRLPLWNPYLYGGQPALADIQSGALYPPHVLQALLLGWGGPLLDFEIGFPLAALQWQVILHFSIASVGCYLFARHLLLSLDYPLRHARFGAVVAALAFTYSGYLTGFPVQQMTILAVSSWLPWVMWGLSAALLRAGRGSLLGAVRPVALGGLAFGLACLAGHPQTVLYLVYLSLAYTLYRGIASRALIRCLALWLGLVLLGTAIAAAQLLPTLAFIDRSLRAELSYQAVSTGLPLNELVSILYPGYFGGSPQYVGIATLVLVALGLGLARPRRELYFWAGAALVSLLLAFGGNLFLYPLFYLLAPGFDVIRQQERVFLVFAFSVALLAGFGAAILVGPLGQARRRTLAAMERRMRTVGLVALFLTTFYVYGATAATARGEAVNLFFGVLRHHLFGLLFFGGMLLFLILRSRRRLRRWWGMTLLAGWVAFNLFTVNWRFNLAEPVEPPPFTPDGVVQFLQANQTDGRIASGGLLPGGNSAASVYRLPDLTGNTPLQLATVDRFMQQMPAWRLWQLLSVRHIVTDREIGDRGLELAFEAGEQRVYRMGDPFPRAWLVAEVEIIPETEAAIERLAADTFDLRATAVVPRPLPTALDPARDASVELREFEPGSLTVEITTSGSQLLVLSQIYDPGWRATLDGQPAELLRANAVLQGVMVPAGTHTVQLTYWPATLSTGLLISGIGLMLFAAGLLLPVAEKLKPA